MLFESFHHVLLIPGIIILFLSGINLRRYSTWRPLMARVVEVNPAIGEFIGDNVKVAYVFEQREQIVKAGQGFCQISRDVKVNDIVKVLVNPLNTRDCIIYSLGSSIFSAVLGMIMIIL